MLRTIVSLYSRQLVSANRFRFTAEEKFVMPKKQTLGRWDYTDLSHYIMKHTDCRTLAALIQDNHKYLIDVHLCEIFQQITRYDLELNDTFYTQILPYSTIYVQAMTRDNATAMGNIAICTAELQLYDTKLWQALVKKLDDQNIYRYLTLRQTAGLFVALADNDNMLEHSLFKKLQKVILQQKAYYMHLPQMMLALQKTVQNINLRKQGIKKSSKPLGVQQKAQAIGKDKTAI